MQSARHGPGTRSHETGTRRASAGPAAPRRSLVRSAVALLLQQPSLGTAVAPPYGFEGLRQPGVDLLLQLLDLIQQRPDITTGALLEHFVEHEQRDALHTLAAQVLPGEPATWRHELLDAVAQLARQTLQQRLDELQAKQRSQGLDEADKYELRALLQARLVRA